jgi:hypothetical protein
MYSVESIVKDTEESSCYWFKVISLYCLGVSEATLGNVRQI